MRHVQSLSLLQHYIEALLQCVNSLPAAGYWPLKTKTLFRLWIKRIFRITHWFFKTITINFHLTLFFKLDISNCTFRLIAWKDVKRMTVTLRCFSDTLEFLGIFAGLQFYTDLFFDVSKTYFVSKIIEKKLRHYCLNFSIYL